METPERMETLEVIKIYPKKLFETKNTISSLKQDATIKQP